MEKALKISELIKKDITGELSSSERVLLDKWLNESNENRNLYKKLSNINYQKEKLAIYNSFNKDRVRQEIEGRLFERKTRVISNTFLKYAAAILVPLLIVVGVSIYFGNQNKLTLATIDEIIQPGVKKATLVLSDGNSVLLDGEIHEKLIEEKGITIINKDSRLNYLAEKRAKVRELIFNELRTPRGGGYNLKLSDGTSVWLNSGSSIRFPVDFTDSIRQVFLSGEAYFDVSHNGKPFIVTSNDMNIRVLGTKFNISAYEDEAQITTTLVEGKVQVELLGKNASANNSVLTTGLQAVVNRVDKDIEVNKVNTSHYTSWINGKLEFNNQDLELVMKRLARWYDFEYTFKNESAKAYHFSARVNADESISEILEMLKMTTNVNFKVENNTIVIN